MTKVFQFFKSSLGVAFTAALFTTSLAAASDPTPVNAPSVGPVRLVSDETVRIQRELTSQHKLKNGIPVVIRQIPDSDILQLDVTFASGLKDLPPGRKVLNEWLWAVLPMGGTGYPKAKVFETVEKYGLELACAGGIEYSSCGLGTLNDYWPEALPLFAALIKSPVFAEEDLKLTKERLVAQLRNTPSDPGQYINEVINSIFYPVGHPYRLNHDEALKELEGLGRNELVQLHQGVLKAGDMALIVVTSLPTKKILQDLETAFGDLPNGNTPKVTPVAPAFEQAKAYAFNDRDLPTAYIRVKLNAPSIRDKDAVAMRLLYEMLSEELGDEIRTRRSLSYAVHSFIIEYSLGVGVISASTSKPKETLEAINDVLQAFKSRVYSQEDVEEHKRGFATSFYLTQETHASLAAALGSARFFYGDPNEHYELPRKLDQVTAQDLNRLAKAWLSNLRVGVIYGRNDFKDEWAEALIQKNLAPKSNQL